MTVAARRGAREQAPQVPSGRIVLQPPPEITPSDGASGLLLQAVPMVGSLGTIGFVAMSQSGPRAWFTAGMFLLASVGFVLASGVRQRQQHTAGVLAARREYLAYLAEVRGTIRDAAGRQREAALWDYPDPAALPAIAAEGTRVWERTPSDADFLQVRMGTTSQPLCLTLEPPETPPLAQLDPVAASALHRLLSTHRVQPGLPASAALRAWAHVEVTGDADPARALARSLVLSAAMQHAPEDLVVAAHRVARGALRVGVAQVAPARAEPARARRRRPGAPRRRVGARPPAAAAAGDRRAAPVRAERPGVAAARAPRRRRRRRAARQPGRHARRRPRRHRARPARAVGRADLGVDAAPRGRPPSRAGAARRHRAARDHQPGPRHRPRRRRPAVDRARRGRRPPARAAVRR